MTPEEAKAWIEANGAKWDADAFKLRLKDGRFVRAKDQTEAASVASNLPPPLP